MNPIGWCTKTWNPTRGCSRVSAGCDNCYAIRQARRQDKPGGAYEGLTRTRNGGLDWSAKIRLVPEKLDEPLRWRKPRRIFVNSMSDLFHEGVPDQFIDQVFAVMALAPRHQFQILTKRPERMREYLGDPATPGRVAKAADRIAVAGEIAKMGVPRILPTPEFPGYFVSDRGDVLSGNGSAICVRCGVDIIGGIARRRYCGAKCRQLDAYHRKMGHAVSDDAGAPRPMKPMPGDDGHQRVMLYRNGEPHRELVHRLVLRVFDREPEPGEEGCHRDGNAANNALPNLRWGTHAGNLEDRRRHGNGRSWSKLTEAEVAEIKAAHQMSAAHLAEQYGVSDTTIRSIRDGRTWAGNGMEWPLGQVHVGVSVEDQETADDRIPLLLQTPAAVRWVSYEPALGHVNFASWLDRCPESRRVDGPRHSWVFDGDDPYIVCHFCKERRDAISGRVIGERRTSPSGLGWVVVGGESGPGARPCDVSWIRSAVEQCRTAQVPVYVKQDSGRRSGQQGRIPDDLWIKEFPHVP